jgi:hypothetical protein
MIMHVAVGADRGHLVGPPAGALQFYSISAHWHLALQRSRFLEPCIAISSCLIPSRAHTRMHARR